MALEYNIAFYRVVPAPYTIIVVYLQNDSSG